MPIRLASDGKRIRYRRWGWVLAILLGVHGVEPLVEGQGTAHAQASAPSGRAEVSSKSSGLPDLVYLQFFGGPSYAHLAAFSDRNLLTLDPSTLDPSTLDPMGGGVDVGGTLRGQLLDEHAVWGHGLGLAAGLRLLMFTVGGRAAWSHYGAFSISTWMLEAGLRPKIFFIEPYLRAGFGYAALASDSLQSTRTAIDGFAAELGAGLDFRVAELLSLGFGADAGLLNLSRETRDLSNATSVSLRQGSAVGGQLRLQGHLTLHL